MRMGMGMERRVDGLMGSVGARDYEVDLGSLER